MYLSTPSAEANDIFSANALAVVLGKVGQLLVEVQERWRQFRRIDDSEALRRSVAETLGGRAAARRVSRKDQAVLWLAVGTALAAPGAIREVVEPAILLACYACWAKADLMLFRS